jgi:hypothetical protein
MYILNVSPGGVTIKRWSDEKVFPLSGMLAYEAFLTAEAAAAGLPVEDLSVAVSSSVDFPEDYSNDPAVIQFARELRPDGWRSNL